MSITEEELAAVVLAARDATEATRRLRDEIEALMQTCRAIRIGECTWRIESPTRSVDLEFGFPSLAMRFAELTFEPKRRPVQVNSEAVLHALASHPRLSFSAIRDANAQPDAEPR